MDEPLAGAQEPVLAYETAMPVANGVAFDSGISPVPAADTDIGSSTVTYEADAWVS